MKAASQQPFFKTKVESVTINVSKMAKNGQDWPNILPDLGKINS
jgi:hypothetical protein